MNDPSAIHITAVSLHETGSQSRARTKTARMSR
jgi:hypothetical protein